MEYSYGASAKQETSKERCSMKLMCLGSSSKGNSYILKGENEVLIIEAGISFKEVKQKLNFKISKIVGVCVSHAHL